MPSLDVPALAPAQPGRTPLVGADWHPMVRMRNGAWQECRLTSWQRHGNGWLCYLSWGVSGTVNGGWFEFDPAKVKEASPHAAG